MPDINFTHYLPNSEVKIDYLRRVINNRPVAIILHGPTLSGLEERILELEDSDICYATVNDFEVPEKHILEKINRRFSILMRSSYPVTLPQINEITSIFLDRQEDNVFISERPSFLPLMSEGFDYDNFIKEYGKKLLFFRAEADYTEEINGQLYLRVPSAEYPLHFPRLNSFSVLLSLVLIGRPSKVVVFGGDGGKIEGEKIYYRDCSAEFLQNNTETYAEQLFIGDTQLFNDKTPAIIEHINRFFNLKPVEIINCSLHSRYTPLKRLSYDDTMPLLKKTSKKTQVSFAAPASKTRVLYLPLEFRTWADAIHWSYPMALGLEEGLDANGVEYVTIPTFANVPSSATTSWLHHARDICAGRQFDQVWFEISHSSLEEPFLEWLTEIAPARVGFLCESLETDPGEWSHNPQGTEKRLKTVEKMLPYLTHVVAVDEADADRFNAQGQLPAMWWHGGAVPQRLIQDPPPPAPNNYAIFYGAIYGERKRWLQHGALRGILVRPEASPELATDLPKLFNELNVTTERFLMGGKPGTDSFFSAYMKSLRYIRRECFALWMQGLQAGCAVVNLPQFGKMYAGRVLEGMAAGRPVISWEIPGRPRTKALFEDGKEILLYSRDDPSQLAAHIQRILHEPDFARYIAENASKKLKQFHSTDKFVNRILTWAEQGKSRPAKVPDDRRSGRVVTGPTNVQAPASVSGITQSLNALSGSLSRLPLHQIHDFNQKDRDKWVQSKAASIPPGSRVLDIGAGTCPYRPLFTHCEYKTHDFKKYGGVKLDGTNEYGAIDYESDVTNIPVPDNSFDVVLCTEVLEHVPEPIEALREMARIVKPGGRVLLTAPLGAGLHQLPYHYYGGYTPEWYKLFGPKFNLQINEITPNGGFFKLLAQECARVTWTLPEHAHLHGNNVAFIKFLFGEWIPRYLFALEEKHFIDQFSVGYNVEAVKTIGVDAAQEMIDADPQNINMYIEAARTLISQNKPSLAEKFIEDGLELDINNPTLLEMSQKISK